MHAIVTELQRQQRLQLRPSPLGNDALWTTANTALNFVTFLPDGVALPRLLQSFLAILIGR
jgi:hypothetical protein